MATINSIQFGYGGEYRRGVWVNVTHSDGGGGWERVLLRNDLPAKRQPDYVRVQYPVLNSEGQAALEATFEARAGSIGAQPNIDWDTENDVTLGQNAVALWIVDSSGEWVGPPRRHIGRPQLRRE